MFDNKKKPILINSVNMYILFVSRYDMVPELNGSLIPIDLFDLFPF